MQHWIGGRSLLPKSPLTCRIRSVGDRLIQEYLVAIHCMYSGYWSCMEFMTTACQASFLSSCLSIIWFKNNWKPHLGSLKTAQSCATTFLLGLLHLQSRYTCVRIQSLVLIAFSLMTCDGLQIEWADLQAAEAAVGDFGGDNRAGVQGTLHRISAIRNRRGAIVGLTVRVGRAVTGHIDMIRDMLDGKLYIFLIPIWSITSKPTCLLTPMTWLLSFYSLVLVTQWGRWPGKCLQLNCTLMQWLKSFHTAENFWIWWVQFSLWVLPAHGQACKTWTTHS